MEGQDDDSCAWTVAAADFELVSFRMEGQVKKSSAVLCAAAAVTKAPVHKYFHLHARAVCSTTSNPEFYSIREQFLILRDPYCILEILLYIKNGVIIGAYPAITVLTAKGF